MNEKLVHTIVRKFENTGIAVDDLTQEGMLALLKAEQTYDAGMGVKFETYASVVIQNRLIDVIRKHKIYLEEDTDMMGTVVGKPLENDVEFQELLGILQDVWKSCNTIERAIFKAKIQGFTYQEIAAKLGVNQKKIDNTIQKIRKQVKLKDGN